MGILTLVAHHARLIVTLAKSERGASLVEYALLLALIAVVCVTALSTFGGELSSNFSSTADAL